MCKLYAEHTEILSGKGGPVCLITVFVATGAERQRLCADQTKARTYQPGVTVLWRTDQKCVVGTLAAEEKKEESNC